MIALLLIAFYAIATNAACVDHMNDCGACVNEDGCSYCQNAGSCTAALCPADDIQLVDIASCPNVNGVCAATPLSNICRLDNVTSIYDTRSIGCASVNDAARPTKAEDVTPCSLAREEDQCANLIRSLGCSYQCQSCNTTVGLSQLLCKSTCDALIADNCAPDINMCTGNDNPFRFICAPNDENCVTEIIGSETLPPAPTVPPPTCVAVTTPDFCLFDANATIFSSRKAECDQANVRTFMTTTGEGVTEAPGIIDPCQRELMNDVWCAKLLSDLTCSVRCQFCGDDDVTETPTQVCPELCEQLQMERCFELTRTRCQNVFRPLCANAPGETCTTKLIAADMQLPARPTDAPTPQPTPVPPTPEPTPMPPTPATTTTVSTTGAPTTTPAATTTIAGVTTTATTTSTTNQPTVEPTDSATTTEADEQTTTASGEQTTTVLDEQTTTVQIDNDDDDENTTIRATLPNEVNDFGAQVDESQNSLMLGVGIGVSCFVLLLVTILIWACQPKKEQAKQGGQA